MAAIVVMLQRVVRESAVIAGVAFLLSVYAQIGPVVLVLVSPFRPSSPSFGVPSFFVFDT